MAIERKPVQRAGIRSAGYDRATRVFEIEFDSGRVVRHTGIGEEVARRFFTSGSPMNYYRDQIADE